MEEGVNTAQSGQPGKLPPATPVYVLRGHAAPIHALEFFGANSRLISGDAEGWVVVWDTATKRPVVAWKAHEGAILGLAGVDYELGSDDRGGTCERRIFTHGRDHKLCIWRLNQSDEASLSKELPVDEATSSQHRSEPWLLHALTVNALNFCGFSMCNIILSTEARARGQARLSSHSSEGLMRADTDSAEGRGTQPDILLAVPNALNTGGIDVFHLPSETRISTISPDPSVETGMVMALELFHTPSGSLCIVSGYEEGSVMVHIYRGSITTQDGSTRRVSLAGPWEKVYSNRAHSQPVLSLSVSPSKQNFLSSSADAIIAKHPITESSSTVKHELVPLKTINTKHAGQQGLRIRSDEKIFATAGWDNRVRVYSCKTMKELAVLKWHKEGCYAVALADVDTTTREDGSHAKTDESTQTLEMTDDGDQRPGNTSLIQKGVGGSLAAIKDRRSRKVQSTHWLAAGSKDGKISLWDIY